jgi:hypothetical protein
MLSAKQAVRGSVKLCGGADRIDLALTIAMDIVANANGSPMMCPKLSLPPRR